MKSKLTLFKADNDVLQNYNEDFHLPIELSEWVMELTA